MRTAAYDSSNDRWQRLVDMNFARMCREKFSADVETERQLVRIFDVLIVQVYRESTVYTLEVGLVFNFYLGVDSLL